MKTQGFTLLGLLLAMAIFAFAGGAIISAATNHVSHIERLERLTFSQWVAANRLVEMRLEKRFPSVGSQRGEVELAGRKWLWQQRTEATQAPDFRAVTISVSLAGDPQTVLYELTTYVSREPAS